MNLNGNMLPLGLMIGSVHRNNETLHARKSHVATSEGKLEAVGKMILRTFHESSAEEEVEILISHDILLCLTRS